jgi:hypothetical protein
MLVVLIASAVIPAARSEASQFVYASPTGFSSLNSGTSVSFGLGDLSVMATRLSSFSANNGLTLGSEVLTFPSTNPANPPWIAGARDMFRLRFDDGDGSKVDGTVTVQYSFSSPLPTTSYLVFADFDVKETLKVQAYDATDTLIPFGSLSFARENGRQIGGDSLSLPTWSSEGGYSGVIAYGNNPISSWSDPVVTLQSSVAISRLVYESDNDPYDTVAHNDIYFNFATPAVPEIDPGVASSAVAGLAGALGLLERRRRKTV